MINTRIYDRAPLKDVRVKEPQVGRVRTPQILMSRTNEGYQKGDILDANSTAILIKNLHNPDIEKLKEQIEEARLKLANAVMNESIGIPGGVASLDGNGNIPTSQLGNVDVDIFMIVNELPTENIKNNKIYCVRDTISTDENNTYIEYAYINNTWEKVGQFKADPDLSQYARIDKSNTFTKKCSFVGASGSDIGLNVLGTTSLEYLTVGSGIKTAKNDPNFLYATNGTYFDVSTLLSKSDYQTDKTNLDTAINNANIAASNVNTAIEQAMKVNAELNGNVLTITNNYGVQKSINLTDSDEHVTINMISNVEGVSLEGVVVNVYINNGATPLQYTTPNSGQIEFTVTKGATYKVVFPDVRDCASINPVQYTASVGNRIIDAVYNKFVNIPEHVKIILTKHDINGNVQYYQNAAVVVTIGKEDPVTYNTDDNGVIELDVTYGSTYSIEVPKINDYYVQYNKYKKTYEANMSSRISKFNYYLYKTGIYIITDAGNEYSIEEWREGGYDASAAKLIKLSNEPLSMASNIIYLRISDITNRTYPNKQWCTENVLFTSISSNGNNSSDPLYYKGKESSDLILNEAEEKGRDVPAFTYAKSQSIEIGGKTIYGYIGSVGQWLTLWANKDGIDDILQELYGDDTQLFSAFTSYKWTSTQGDAGSAWGFAASPFNFLKTVSCLPVPFFAY